jgi:hypothetical protein
MTLLRNIASDAMSIYRNIEIECAKHRQRCEPGPVPGQMLVTRLGHGPIE